MSGISRRQFLASTAGAFVGVRVTSGRVAADHRDAKPEHVTISYTESTLSAFQPLLDLTEEDKSRLLGQYAWTATSPEHDTDCHVYWTAYTHQSGVTEYDSHYGDHEPAYVFVDSQTGEIQEVVASIYHWLRGRALASGLRIENETNPVLGVITPWHQYTAPAPQEDPTRPELSNLDNAFDDWLANGLEEALEPGVVVNPWRMQGADGRGHWWRDTVASISFDAAYMRILRTIGLHEAGSL
jgi:hypothetical protein